MTDRWIVELVIDTGQRMLSAELDTRQASALVEEMRSRIRVVAVSMLHTRTGEALTFASHNVRAAFDRRCPDKVVLAAALGGPEQSI